MSIISLVIIASILAIAFAAFNFATVKKMDEGTDKMKEIASAIRIGSNAFINYEYKVLCCCCSSRCTLSTAYQLAGSHFTNYWLYNEWSRRSCSMKMLPMQMLEFLTKPNTKDIGKTVKLLS